MNYIEKLENVTVLGAAGKMGSSITLIVAMEMLRLKMKPENKDKHFLLYAMDISHKLLDELLLSIGNQAIKFAEKNIVMLRKWYASYPYLIDNEEVICQYRDDLLSMIHTGIRIEPAFDSRVIFEAVSERPDLKVELMLTINRSSRLNPLFFTNTSAIPIGWLDEEAGLKGRIMGLHFYNPPIEQNLLEVIKTETTHPEVSYFVAEFIQNLGKSAVPAYDVPGFIGNGYLMRDVLHAQRLVDELEPRFSFPEAIYMINTITQDFMIRPMGIFQIMDYMGIDVVQFIMSVMHSYAENESLHSASVDVMISNGIRGGQNQDGSQKDGFFKYTKGQIAGVYDKAKRRYLPVSEVNKNVSEYLGPLPVGWQPWIKVVKDQDKNDYLRQYFFSLKQMDTEGAKMALDYLKRFREIGQGLVKNKVAFRFDDVNAVVTRGFHHAYPPVTDLF